MTNTLCTLLKAFVKAEITDTIIQVKYVLISRARKKGGNFIKVIAQITVLARFSQSNEQTLFQ